jgi:hypothetical protein
MQGPGGYRASFGRRGYRGSAPRPLDLPRANAITAAILDELLARRTGAGRPADRQSDDLAFIRAASGRSEHADARFALVI